MSNQHEISEYIDNLPLQKTFCKGFRPDDVYDVICTISSMYNQILSEAYAEIEELKRKLEYIEVGQGIRQDKTSEKKISFPGNSDIKSDKNTDISLETILEEFVKNRSNLKMECDREKIVIKESSEDDMTDKEIQRLKRGELLEVLLEQSKENEALRIQLQEKENEIEELKKKLEDRKIEINKAGTIAEASFKLNGVFEAAEKAAQQYLDNLQELYEKEDYLYTKKEAEVENRCSALLHATQERCEFMKEDILKKCEDMEESVREQCENLLKATEIKCREREREVEEKCKVLDQKAKSDVDKRWDDLSKRLEDFYTAHEGLKELLASSKMI